jgi:2-amino-4-hydroxy-6-hydroxymethyldihydropteridine diphosphokinase
VVNDRRRDHIARVTALLDDWARAMRLGDDEAREWHDAGLWHDALRDAPEPVLRTLAEDDEAPAEMLHGPAAARRLEADGERRPGLLDAVRWHTVGNPRWARTGRALYMADYLEPGRNFAREDRAFLARLVPVDFDGAFRQVVRARLEWTLREGRRVYPGTVELWNDVH